MDVGVEHEDPNDRVSNSKMELHECVVWGIWEEANLNKTLMDIKV